MEEIVQELPKSRLFDFGEGVYRIVRRSSVVHMVDMVVVGVPRRNGSTLSFTESAEEVVGVLRDLRSEFCVFGGTSEA